jgi:nitrite reductase/ring-hydroxylating ferredoxin subunit
MRFNLFGTNGPGGIITITRAPGDVFYAMSAYCTHNGCIVDPYDPTPGTEKMICYCHNSEFDIQGQYLGGPASGNLPAYNTAFDGTTLRVEIPNLNFKVNGITPATAVSGIPRFQISFPAKAGGKYRILHTADLTSPPVTVAVALSAGGAASTTQINQVSTAVRNVWVPSSAARGFYMVEMIVTEFP